MDSDRVYIAVGRGCGKTRMQAKMIEELTKAGKTVVLIEPKCTTNRTKGFTYAGAIIDLDILTPEQMERADRILKEVLKGDNNGTKTE